MNGDSILKLIDLEPFHVNISGISYLELGIAFRKVRYPKPELARLRCLSMDVFLLTSVIHIGWHYVVKESGKVE